jgi:hypothetical protein
LLFLSQHPDLGDIVPGYEGKIRKIRGQLKSYNEGKRGGLRIIYYYGSLIAPLFIYGKRQMADAPKEIIQRVIELIEAWIIPHELMENYLTI